MAESNGMSYELRKLLREHFPRERTYLLPALHLVQEKFGYLPDWALLTVAQHLRVPASEVYGSASSYTELHLEAPAQHRLRVCVGLSCWMNGGQHLLEAAQRVLKGEIGDAATNSIELEETPCGYLCAVAPAIQWDGAWIGRSTPSVVAGLVSEVRS